ncbi:MAG TPA: ATP-dependent DNA helicase [Candidatus Acidoferrales bacterium]|nr:ATP-dependent DNA helicase [Candidatus Acidoferrales bacterium]
MISSDAIAELNADQRAVVEHGEGPLLVVAGAGTGKTRVITRRICQLLETHPELSAENILGLTFTDKAADEMKARVMKLAGARADGVWLSTFHKFSLEKILRDANPELQTIEPVEHWILLRKNLRELALKHYTRLAEPGEFLSDFEKFFSRCQDELVTPEQYQCYVDGVRRAFETQKSSLNEEARAAEEESLARLEEVSRAYRISERLQRERNLITFGGQLLRSVELLRANDELLAKLREQYQYILVDEFQDTNIAQLELLWLLSAERRNILAVGDDSQAIYRFRGASFGSFTIFLERFCRTAKGASAANPARLPLKSLTRNYRSTKHILDVASGVIQHNERPTFLPHKALVTENPAGEKIRVAEFASPDEEAHWVVSEIERLHAAGRPWRSCAVLYRKHAHRTRIVDVLRRKKIPFVIRGLSLLSSTLVRDLIAYLRLIAVRSDNVACLRVLAAPYWGFEPRDLVRLAERARKNQALMDVLESPQGEFAFAPEMKSAELLAFLKTSRQLASRASARTVFDALVAELGLSPLPSDADRMNLERFAKFLADWESKSEDKSLFAFIEYFDFFLQAGGEIPQREESADDAVQLLTVHNAKGMEFDHVFVLTLSEGDFPARPQAPVLEFPAALMKEEQPKGEFRIQEERRLFYVALTRARRLLTLSTVVNNRKKPSPFLEDILEDPRLKSGHAEQLTPKVRVPKEEETVGSLPADPLLPQLFPAIPADSRAYSRIALWVKAYHPPTVEPLQLSASAIETYRTCPMKYSLQQMWGIRGGPQAAMTFGTVMHLTIREFVRELRKQRKVTFNEVAETFDREWRAAGFQDDYQEQEYRNAGREQLQAFCASYASAPADVLYQEKAFELPLDSGVVVTGRMDQVNRLVELGPKKIEIVDYKTGNPKRAKQADSSLQLSLYALAAQEVFELEAERLVFYNLTTNEAVATTRDARALKKAKAIVAEAADSIRAGDFPARPGFSCRYCDYGPICPAHEQLISIANADWNK